VARQRTATTIEEMLGAVLYMRFVPSIHKESRRGKNYAARSNCVSGGQQLFTKLCRTQAELILKHVNPNVHGIGQEEGRHRKYQRLKLGGDQAYAPSADQLQFQSSYIKLRHNLMNKLSYRGNFCMSCAVTKYAQSP
jgi:hypothetical protein